MAVNFSGLSQVSQPTTMKKVPKAEVTFQAKPQADTVSFGMAKQAKVAAEAAKNLGKIGAVKAFVGKIAAPVVKFGKAIVGLIVKCVKALNPMPLIKKAGGLFSKLGPKVKDAATNGANAAKDLIKKAPKA